MFGLFLVVLGSALARGIDPGSCGCFGIGMTLSIHKTLALDITLLILSLLVAAVHTPCTPFSTDSWINK
jgi:hypothetical protein